MASRTLRLSSFAARSVNVVVTISSGSRGVSSSAGASPSIPRASIRTYRAVSVVVLPVPAPAVMGDVPIERVRGGPLFRCEVVEVSHLNTLADRHTSE
jgi:hypothetical protein